MKYQKWMREKRFSCFYIENDSLFCNICSSKWKFKKKRKEFISFGAHPKRKCSLIKHLFSRIHQKSKKCVLSLGKRLFLRKNKMKNRSEKKNTNKIYLFQFDKRIIIKEDEEKEIIEIVKDKLRIVLFMISSNIPNNKYCSLQELINTVGENKLLSLFKHNSTTSFLDFLQTLFNTYKKIIIENVNIFKHFSILVDDSVNVLNQNQVCIFVRYIDNKLNLRTSFLALKDLGNSGGTSSNLMKIIEEVLINYNLKKENIVAFASDGAANMIGEYNGLIAKLKNYSPIFVSCHCSIHRLNLVLKESISDKEFDKFDLSMDIFNEISNYIDCSSTKKSMFHLLQLKNNKKNKKIKKPIQIRWCSNYDCLISILDNFSIILEFLLEQPQQKSGKANQLLKRIQSYVFFRNSSVLKSILEKFNKAIINLQKINIDIGEFEEHISEIKHQLLSIKKNGSAFQNYAALKFEYCE
jgi:3-dehydroquinate dehydratase